jgi:hypothetical protein
MKALHFPVTDAQAEISRLSAKNARMADAVVA